METPELVIQGQSDIDDQIAKRIKIIENEFGSLDKFFARLHEIEDESSDPPSEIDKLIERHLTLAGRVAKPKISANS